MNNNPLVSVIIPIFNVERFLVRCIESVLNQTYTNLEIILVDDGSTDNCYSICDDFQKKDDRIVVVHKTNGGLSDARNAGIDMANGKYLFFLDSDDYIKNDAISISVQHIQKSNCDLSIFCFLYVDELGLPLTNKNIDAYKDIKKIWNEDDFWFYMTNGMSTECTVAWNKLYKRKLFENVRYEKGKTQEDEFIIHRVVSQCAKICFIPSEHYFYTQRSNSISNTNSCMNEINCIYAYIGRVDYFINNNKEEYAINYFKSTVKRFRKNKKAIRDSANYLPSFYDIQKEIKRIYKAIMKFDLKKRTKVALFLFFRMNLFYSLLYKLIN